MLGTYYLDLNNYHQAKNCFMKMLLGSWFLQLKDAELLAYDLIGKCYYY